MTQYRRHHHGDRIDAKTWNEVRRRDDAREDGRDVFNSYEREMWCETNTRIENCGRK